MSVPTKPIPLMIQSYRKIFPTVHKELKYWKRRAKEIPDEELRRQAIASINAKKFHCEGGAILSLLANEHYQTVIKFIVAYQTISDYLDNLCDRSTSLDAEDFRALHESMIQSLNLDHSDDLSFYYRNRKEQDDGGYLVELVQTCRNILKEIPNYPLIKNYLLDLCQYYCDLQVHKHVAKTERMDRLKNWFESHRSKFPDMEWYEFSACTGSTLGIFCLVSYACRRDFTDKHAELITNGYFPYIQGLHILLDYLIDQKEDETEGDLNFVSYYQDNSILFKRVKLFFQKAESHTAELPDGPFHSLINRGLLGIYLSDHKVKSEGELNLLAKQLIKIGGMTSLFFYLNGRAYRKLQNISGLGSG